MSFLMQALWEDTWKNTVEKSSKCYQCDYASSQAIHLRTHHNVTMHPLMQALWWCIWNHTEEKSQTNATSVTMDPILQVIWGSVWKCTVEKNFKKLSGFCHSSSGWRYSDPASERNRNWWGWRGRGWRRRGQRWRGWRWRWALSLFTNGLQIPNKKSESWFKLCTGWPALVTKWTSKL